ncbi:MAG: hypothetical protein KF780_06920 [Sphingomonas sp.]|nr:hypothetical protein [Sphingomonas sp.]
MRRLLPLVGAVLALLAHVHVAQARDQLGQRDPVVIDPQKAYIFFRSNIRADLRLLREVTPAQAEAHAAARETAFARAHDRQQRRIVQWERLQSSCRDNARLAYCADPRPDEMMRDAFEASYPPPEMGNFVDIMGGRLFARDGDNRGYFMTLEPGVYTIYGDMIASANGVIGTCLCMGSVTFEARAGEIADLGEIGYPIAEAIRAGRSYNPGISNLTAMSLTPYTESMASPDRLAGHSIVPARFRAADKMPNYFGILVSRMTPVAGVLGYERDRVIDVASAGTETATSD